MSSSRATILRRDLDIVSMTGLEIGPLADPVVRKSEGRVVYVDHTDTESLRTTYRDNALVEPADIVDVDAIWGDRTLAEALAPLLGDGARIDYVVASHVAEHVPDLVTWLAEVTDVLRPGGTLRLALPDRRFSFDALRGPTRLVDTLAAWVVRARKPQVRDVLDFRLHYAPDVRPFGIYDGTDRRDELVPAHSFDKVVEIAGWARDLDVYLDVHCTVAHPREWAELMAGLAELGLLRMACVEMIDTTTEMFEFYVVMTPCADHAHAVSSWRTAATAMADPLPGSVEAQMAEAMRAQAKQLPGLQATVAGLTAELAEARARVVGLEQSRSWRLTAPLRRLKR